MTSREIYKRFLLKVNKNDTNEGVNILPGIFVLMFNTESIRWLGDQLNENGDNIKLDHLDKLLVTDSELVKSPNKGDDWYEYILPEDFYRHSASYGLVKTGNCDPIKVFYFEKKPLGLSAILADDFSKASLDYEEGPFIITQGKIKAYVDDFEISKFYVSYYKVPNKIDIAGYPKEDGTISVDVDSTLSDDNIDEILNRMAVEVNRETENPEGFQYSKDRVATEP